MFRVPATLLEASLASLRGWYSSVNQQKARHVFSLFPVLAASQGALNVEYFESDDEAFLKNYMAIPSAEESHPFFDPFSSTWLPKSYAHSNVATFRKRTFFRSWNAGSWSDDQVTLAPNYALTFQQEALTKAGQIHRIPAWAFAVWIAATSGINRVGSPVWPEAIPDTAAEISDLLQTWLGMNDADWRNIFDSNPPDSAYYEGLATDEASVVDSAEMLRICLAAAPAPQPTVSFRRGLELDKAERPADAAELANRLFLPVETVTDMLWLLKDRRSLILTGPPGVGKSFVARQIAHFFGNDAVTYVQFHPSYSYEYFVSGYRPTADDDGNVRYEIVPGPLLSTVKHAIENRDAPAVLVIDEINRANVGAVFGELIGALEYRNEPVRLQYSSPDGDQSLTVPENFYILGTMNQADRSAVNFDAAIRRRFAFFECSPVSGPFEPVLREYLAAKFDGNAFAWVAEWVAAINSKLPDADFAIGGSYFLGREDLSPSIVRRIFNYEILPYIKGHFPDEVAADIRALSAAYLEREPGRGHSSDSASTS
jgi:hypothetical protein